MSEKLEKCPFCGGTPDIAPTIEQVEHDSWVASINCNSCDVSLTPQYTSPSQGDAVSEAIATWNKRHSLQASAQQDEREAFEAWLQPYWTRDKYMDPEGDLIYREAWVQGAWIAWQARGQQVQADARQNLSNLLARIHRDGGHYEAEHGAQKAVDDADSIVASLYAAQADAGAVALTEEERKSAAYLNEISQPPFMHSKYIVAANKLLQRLIAARPAAESDKRDAERWRIFAEALTGACGAGETAELARVLDECAGMADIGLSAIHAAIRAAMSRDTDDSNG